jgi:hypothetical protein
MVNWPTLWWRPGVGSRKIERILIGWVHLCPVGILSSRLAILLVHCHKGWDKSFNFEKTHIILCRNKVLWSGQNDKSLRLLPEVIQWSLRRISLPYVTKRDWSCPPDSGIRGNPRPSPDLRSRNVRRPAVAIKNETITEHFNRDVPHKQMVCWTEKRRYNFWVLIYVILLWYDPADRNAEAIYTLTRYNEIICK